MRPGVSSERDDRNDRSDSRREKSQAKSEALVMLTAQLDGVPATLAREHRSDDHGCCVGCKLPQSGNQVWPCTLFALGVAATEARAGRFRRLAS